MRRVAIIVIGAMGCGVEGPVDPPPPPPIVVSLEIAEIDPLTFVGQTVQLEVTGVMSDGTRRIVDPTLVEWQSSDTAVAVIAGGVVTALRGGNTTINANHEGHAAEVDVAVWISTLSEVSVRVMYVVPAEVEFRDDYGTGIARAIVDVQAWYRRQLDGLTFDVYSVVPEQCRLPEGEEYYSHGHTWDKILEGLQPCAPVEPATVRFSWVVYVDVEELCGEPHELGKGTSGLTMLARSDLELMQNPGTRVYCTGVWERSYVSILGGLAHELGHTFGLRHPRDCRAGLVTCDQKALMWTGYYNYPDTYFREDEKENLRRSPFIKR